MIQSRLVVATSNQGKLNEIRTLLDDTNWLILGLADFNLQDTAIIETGNSYLENALAKANHIAKLTGIMTLADDSGLEVNALGGSPGVVTARFGGPLLNDNQRCQYLLKLLSDIPKQKRQACFRAVLAISVPGGLSFAREGILKGYIAQEIRGENGFGYDPIFEIQDGRTLAEMGTEKQQISHRFKAIKAIKKVLLDFHHD
ncbi:MAG: non-canonical purine NTP pyrophosphatase, RdgB/HAM1 family [Chloroflexi bacterium]|nr:non-canonical purine NTP pyrophosphatase, RdgB/HAM1 family [Chloroflexota bacterium]|tara:strand:+ start:4064 stop:4666 length:603 start_codon:yes stop_codon:yes gene_type:complete